MPNVITIIKTALVCLIAGTLITSCQCTNVECSDTAEAFVELNFLSNGNNVFFGENAILPIEDLSIITQPETHFSFSTIDNKISLGIQANLIYEIAIGNIDTISLKGSLKTIDSDGCCDTFGVSEIEIDEEEFCDNCFVLNINL